MPCSLFQDGRLLARIIHESAAPTADMGVLQDVLGSRTLRRTIQVRLGMQDPAVAQWQAHLHGLATPIRELPGLRFEPKR